MSQRWCVIGAPLADGRLTPLEIPPNGDGRHVPSPPNPRCPSYRARRQCRIGAGNMVLKKPSTGCQYRIGTGTPLPLLAANAT